MSLRLRLGAVVALVLLLGWQAVGGFFEPDQREAAWWLPDDAVRLGLDLRGGIHMVLSPDLEVALDRELNSLKDGFEQTLTDESVTGVKLFVSDREFHIQPSAPADAAKVEELLADWNVVDIARPDAIEFVLTLTTETTERVRNEAMGQALEVLRRRIDDPQTGIPESVITKQGKERILIQIPGMDRVPDILGTTGFLEFKIVQDVAPTEDLLRAKYESGLPDGMIIGFERDRESDRILNAYLIPANADITGERLTDARVGFDNRRNEWLVTFTWDAEGGRVFGELTEANLQKPLAIILDGSVFSAPTIQSRISRNGQITGRFTSQEATDLAIILRAGALPIPLRIEEERTIGPALGADSIQRGLRASFAGLLMIVVFMLGYYRLSGGYASIALFVNLVMIGGLMSIFQGTLTVPGIAGLVLTVGMAVDANVIIFERIREEVKAGRTPRAAIAAGFQKARWTILDANITTLGTAIILYSYGTGPIKGFAVTLSVGILTSVFAALVLTRLLYEVHPGQKSVSELSI
ncbi:MAG: protein translocase subunit SecD [bacterium]|nr:protein translocase subunit SecD [bacterium]